MRTCSVLGLCLASMLSFASIACGGDAGDAAQAAAGVAGEAGSAGTAGATAGTGGAGAASGESLDALVKGSGTLSTDDTADPAPVPESEPEDVREETPNGAFVCTEQNFSLTKVPEKFVALNPNADVLYPGSLLQGASMTRGVLDPIPAERAGGAVTLTISSGGTGRFFRDVDQVSLASMTQAQNDILAEYDGATPAKFSYSMENIYSMDQLAVAVSANVKGSTWEASAALSFEQSTTKSRVLIQFTQEYFTMAYGAPAGMKAVFAPGVGSDDLRPYMGEGNPPVYVASVTYGRIFYLLFESSASQTDLMASLSAAFSATALSGGGSVDVTMTKVVNESTVKAYGLGGNAQAAIAAAAGYGLDDPSSPLTQQELVQKFLTEGATFNKDNPGVPISYTLRNLYDSSQVKLALTTEYTARDCKPVKKGCDGIEGSTKVEDACGVCGGDGSSCRPCGAATQRRDFGNGAYFVWDLPAGSHGEVKDFGSGYKTSYKFPECRGAGFTAVKFTCSAGTWHLDGNSGFRTDALCHGSTDLPAGMSYGVR